MLTVPACSISFASSDDGAAEVLLLPIFAADSLDDVALDDETADAIRDARARRELKGAPWEVVTFSRAASPRRVLTVGLGERSDLTTDLARKHAAVSALAARQRAAGRVAYVVRAELGAPAFQQVVAEGLALAAFDVDTYKSAARETPPLASAVLVAGRGVTPDAASIARGVVFGESTNLARALANEPGNALPPRALADEARQAGLSAGLDVVVLDETQIRERGMGLLVGVGRGSVEPPRLIELKYSSPAARPETPVLGLVGKGVTFDTGGISIKPSEQMDRMKFDMAGAAAVVGAMSAIARLGAPVSVVGVIAAAENMPDGGAFRPGDVLRSASGKTVEITNTDAEGRLVLGDALWYARQAGATHLVDVATLTGACVIALGRTYSGLFATPDAWADTVAACATDAGDPVWRMPLHADYLAAMKSDIADLVNAGGRAGGSATAAAFLREFVGDVPWAHLDIAGTAWSDEPRPWMPKGPTGTATRTLAQLACGGRW